MKSLRNAAAVAALTFLVLALVACAATTSSGGGGTISITSSAGTLTGSNPSWTFDAGTVPQYTTESITFTVSNTTSSDFIATGSQQFTPSGDFSDSLSGSFTVAAHSTNSFTGSVFPTGTPGTQETGTMTLTPSGGSPITINLKVTPDGSFAVTDAAANPFQPPVVGTVYYNNGGPNTFQIINNSASATITLTGGSNYVAVSGAGYSISTQPASATIGPNAGSVSFDVGDSNGSPGGNPGTITISGVNSSTGATFTFTGPIIDSGVP
jgi:hypothetical protein